VDNGMPKKDSCYFIRIIISIVYINEIVLLWKIVAPITNAQVVIPYPTHPSTLHVISMSYTAAKARPYSKSSSTHLISLSFSPFPVSFY